MKTLLRSVFVADSADDVELFQRNYLALVESGLGFDTKEDNLIWQYVRDFFSSHTHVPEISTVRSHFERLKEMEVVDRIETVINLPSKTRGDFLRHLEEKVEDRRSRLLLEYLKTMARIVTEGHTIKEKRGETRILKGAFDAARFFQEKSHDLIAPAFGSKLTGDLISDTPEFRSHYDLIESDPTHGIGQFSGISQMDKAFAGAKRAELWTHAAFTGHGKSSLALQWAYNQAITYRYSVFFLSLEMPYHQCLNMIHSMHTYHEKFREVRIQLGIQKPSKQAPDGSMIHYDQGLDYEKVKNARLDPHEKKFLFDYVEPDFVDPANGYGAIHLEVADPDKSDFTVADLKTKAELTYARDPFKMMVIDHMGLMSPRKKMSNTTENLNEVIRDLKRLAMSFRRGLGIAILGLFQISREGFRSAEKADGRYNLTHLSYANECTIGATLVWTSKGLKPLEEVEIGDRVWSRSGWKPVLDFFDQGERPTWEVVLNTAASIEVTGNHRVRVLDNEQIAWKRAQDLSPQDHVLSVGCHSFPTEAPKLRALSFYKMECKVARKGQSLGLSLCAPETLNPEVSYLLGAYDGDGKLHRDGIGYTGNRKEAAIRDRLRDLFRQEFGQHLNLLENPSRQGSFDLIHSSFPLKRWFEDVSGPRGKKVPDVIFQAPKSMVLSYLQGLFDTDGWINNQGIVGLKMASKEYLQEVQVLLQTLGYDTNLASAWGMLKATGKRYKGWTLRLRGFESREQFEEEIGFTEPHKAETLNCWNTKPVRNRKTQILPLGKTFAALAADYAPYSLITKGRLKKAFYNSVERARDTGFVSRGSLKLLLGVMEEGGHEDPRTDLLREVLRLQVIRVVSSKPTGRTERVYDIEVDGDHEYQTGPLLSHNCERSSDIVTAGWLDEELKAKGRMYIQCLKSRDSAPFERFAVRVEWHCRRILTDLEGIEGEEKSDDQKLQEAEDIGNALDEAFSS